jgi:thioredoxin 1
MLRCASVTEEIMSDVMEEIGERDFDEKVMRSEIPVLVDFWAPWCAPCRMVSPVLESIARDSAGVVKVAKVNVDENQALASRLGIHGIPTVMLFDAGKVRETLVGARPRSEFLALVGRAVGVPAG